MTKKHEQFEKKIHTFSHIRLSEADKERARSFLTEYMAMNPIRARAPISNGILHRLQNSLSSMIPKNPPPFRFRPILTVLIMLALSGGTALAAEDTLPGDTLYPIKINVLEEMRSLFSLSPLAKVEWALERTERRLEETSRLTALKRLTERESTLISTQIERHIKAVFKHALTLESLNNGDVLTDTEARLRAILMSHERILALIQGHTKNEATQIPVAHVVERAYASANAAPQEAHRNDAIRTATIAIEESTVSTTSSSHRSLEGRRSATQARINAAERVIQTLSGKVPTHVEQEVRETLEAARGAFHEGELLAEEDRHAEALEHFAKAFQLALESQSFMSARARIVDVTTVLGLEEVDVQIATSTNARHNNNTLGKDNEETWAPATSTHTTPPNSIQIPENKNGKKTPASKNPGTDIPVNLETLGL